MRNKQSTAIVLDWDGVVADDDMFKQRLAEAVETFGVGKEKFRELYQGTKDHNGYNPIRFAQRIAEITGQNLDLVARAVDDVTMRTAQYLFNDAVKFIDDAESAGYEVLVLTAGDERLQAQKVLSSQLRHKFKDVHIVSSSGTTTNKASVLHKLAKEYDRIYFYDDKFDTIQYVRKEFQRDSAVVSILVDRNLSGVAGTGGLVVDQLILSQLEGSSLAI